jgi:preprotein translocase subunit YajC
MLRTEFPDREQNATKETLMLRTLLFSALLLIVPLLAGCQPPGGGTGTGTGTGASGGSSDILMSILPLILIFVVFYFLLIRPQQRKQKAHKELLAGVKRGDDIVTTGGMIGTVIKVDRDDNLLVEVAPNVRIKFMRTAVAEIVRRPAPARATEDDDEPEEETDTDESAVERPEKK